MYPKQVMLLAVTISKWVILMGQVGWVVRWDACSTVGTLRCTLHLPRPASWPLSKDATPFHHLRAGAHHLMPKALPGGVGQVRAGWRWTTGKSGCLRRQRAGAGMQAFSVCEQWTLTPLHGQPPSQESWLSVQVLAQTTSPRQQAASCQT